MSGPLSLLWHEIRGCKCNYIFFKMIYSGRGNLVILHSRESLILALAFLRVRWTNFVWLTSWEEDFWLFDHVSRFSIGSSLISSLKSEAGDSSPGLGPSCWMDASGDHLTSSRAPAVNVGSNDDLAGELTMERARREKLGFTLLLERWVIGRKQ